MAVLKKIESHPGVVDYFKELPFYNIHIEKPKIKNFKNIDLLSELPFYEELSVLKTSHTFTEYTMSHGVKLVEKKDPIMQLKASKSSIKDSFSDLLNEPKGFKYQKTLNVKKCKPNEEIEFRPVSFNSTTRTVINHRFSLYPLINSVQFSLIDSST